MEDASDDGVFVHVPFFEDFFDSKGVDNVGLTSFAKLFLVGRGGDFYGAFDARRIFGLVGFFVF